MQQAPITDIADLRRFMFAGKPRFTIRSKRTGTRFTYRVKASKDQKVFFVGVLTGPENEAHYTYLGTYSERGYSHGRKSAIGPDAPSALAFQFVARCLDANRLHEQLEVWHEGRCGRCSRLLTVPESIASGIGPECATRERHFLCEAA